MRGQLLQSQVESRRYSASDATYIATFRQGQGMTVSMGSRGDCFDNAMAGSFFATLECELLARQSFPTRNAARLTLFDYGVTPSTYIAKFVPVPRYFNERM